MDEKEIRAALDAFEADDYVTAKEKLQAQIGAAKENYLKTRLGIQGSVFSPSAVAQEPIDKPAEPVVPKDEPVVVKPTRRSLTGRKK